MQLSRIERDLLLEASVAFVGKAAIRKSKENAAEAVDKLSTEKFTFRDISKGRTVSEYANEMFLHTQSETIESPYLQMLAV